MNKWSIVLGALFAASLCHPSIAATVSFAVHLNVSGPGTFEVRAKASQGDNFGIALYGVPLQPLPGATITSVSHVSPRSAVVTSPDGAIEGSFGFTLLRSANGNPALTGAQDTITPTPFLIRGYGQWPGFLNDYNAIPSGLVVGGSWGAVPVIASGTYTGPGLKIDTESVNFLANVFSAESGAAVFPARVVVPEPNAAAIFSIASLGLAIARWRPRHVNTAGSRAGRGVRLGRSPGN